MELYQFQKEDVEKLAPMKSAAIGSEMGAGKTHEAIALDDIWNDAGKKPTLVVAPLNTFDSWQEKYGEQSPYTSVTVIDRKNRGRFVDAIRRGNGNVFLMHWDALRLMPELQQFEFEVIIADEAHRATNRDAAATQALKALQTNHKLALSGTLSGNRPDGLWSVFNWLWPKYYTSYWRFRRHYCTEEDVWNNNTKTYFKQITGVQNEESLKAEIDPWYVRHLKRECCCPHHPNGVMSWLPDKTYDHIFVDLNATQRRIYNEMRDNMVAWIGEHENDPLVAQIVIAQMTRLSQIGLATPDIYQVQKMVNNPFFEYEDGPVQDWMQVDQKRIEVEEDAIRLVLPSTKLDALKGYLSDHREKQFVVFSSSRQICYLAKHELEKIGISSEVLSGKTGNKLREDIKQRFRDGDFQVFLGTIGAAAEGIDGLQHATDTAIFLDRSWSNLKNRQAEDRLDRPGQKNTIQIIDIMARDTIDMGRMQQLELKWDWIKKILGDKRA